MAKIHDLNKQRLDKVAEARKLVDENPGDKWTGEVDARWAAINGEIDALGTQIEAEQKSEEAAKARAARLAEIEAQSRAANGDRRIGFDASDRREDNPEHKAADLNRRFEAVLRGVMRGVDREDPEAVRQFRDDCKRFGFNRVTDKDGSGVEFSTNTHRRASEPAWCVAGQQGLRKAESRAGLDVGTSGAGQETIPEGFFAELDRKMLMYSPVRNICRVVGTASGNALPWPKVDDTGNTGELLAEATTIGTSVDPTFSAVTMNAYKFSSKPIFISQELIEDTAFNLSSEIASMLGERLGRVEGTYTTTGTGSSQPQGVVTGAATGKTAASTTAFTADEVIDLVHSVDPAYRMGASGFAMNDAVLLYARKLKLADGQYLWQPGMSAGTPDRLYGYPVAILQGMSSTFTTGQKLILFGDFSKFVVRDVANVRFYRLDERYRDTDQTAFIAFKRLDSKMIQSAAVKLLVLG